MLASVCQYIGNSCFHETKDAFVFRVTRQCINVTYLFKDDILLGFCLTHSPPKMEQCLSRFRILAKRSEPIQKGSDKRDITVQCACERSFTDEQIKSSKCTVTVHKSKSTLARNHYNAAITYTAL